MLEQDILKTIYKNDMARNMLKLNKSFLSRKINKSEIFKKSVFKFLNSTDPVLYILISENVDNQKERSLFKIDITNNTFISVKQRRKNAIESVYVDYMNNHDFNLSLDFGSVSCF